MLLIFGLMVLMFQKISCVDQTCGFNRTEICYAALGHKLSLQMVLDFQHYDAKITHHKTGNTTVDPICAIKNDLVTYGDLCKNRSNVKISNGTVMIENVMRGDSGRYTLQLFDPDGSITSRDLQVSVEAPIGSVNVSVRCMNEMRRVFCSSDGDELIFKWILNGVNQTERNNTIDVYNDISGNIMCSVKNNISYKEKNITLNDCPESSTGSVTIATFTSSGYDTSLSNSNLTCTQKPEEKSWKFPTHVLIVLACVTGIVIVLFITVCLIYKRKKPHGRSTSAAQEDTELIYADINQAKPNKDHKEMSPAEDVEYAAVAPQKKRKEMKNEELQYGEVTFTALGSNIPQQHQQICKKQDECVYSQIRTHKLKHV